MVDEESKRPHREPKIQSCSSVSRLRPVSDTAIKTTEQRRAQPLCSAPGDWVSAKRIAVATAPWKKRPKDKVSSPVDSQTKKNLWLKRYRAIDGEGFAPVSTT